MIGHIRLSSAQFYRLGGPSNPRLVRVTRNGEWAYFMRAD